MELKILIYQEIMVPLSSYYRTYGFGMLGEHAIYPTSTENKMKKYQ
jgi:hypothetical protein